MKRKILMALLTAALSFSLCGCGEKADDPATDGQEQATADRPEQSGAGTEAEEQSGSGQNTASEAQSETTPETQPETAQETASETQPGSLEAWYKEEHIEQRAEWLSTETKYKKAVEYKAVQDGSVMRGWPGVQEFSLVTPELTEAEVQKTAAFYFQNLRGENVVQYEVKVKAKGKMKYHYILRYGDKHRTKMLIYPADAKTMGKNYVKEIDTDDCGEKADGDYTKLRYAMENVSSEPETHTHPQLKKQVRGIIEGIVITLFDDAGPEEIAKMATAALQKHVDEYIKDDPDSRASYLGSRVSVVQYGKTIAENLVFIWDENKENMLPYDEKTGKILTEKELAEKIAD